jgi:CubicO group peptidase (beta-lactamase class C family)
MKVFFSILIACSLAFVARAEDPTPKSTLTPERVKAALAELEKLAEKTIKTAGAPGIGIAVVHQDKVIYQKGFGVREAGKPELIDADTVFQLASVSKPITSTILAALVGEGKIDWDDRVIDHDPGFRMYDPWVTREVRLRDFLCHRSGLPDHWGDLLEDMGYDRDEILRRAEFQPPASSFRSQYAYTNFGYSEAAYAVAKAVGTPWDELAAKKLFEPLGMKSTSTRFADYAQAKNRALIHVRVGGKWTPKNTRQPDAQTPAGGVSSTLRDMTQWLRLQAGAGKFDGKQLVAAQALAETHTPQFVFGLSPDQGRLSSYGLGWNVSVERGGRVFWKHSGGFSLGERTEVAVLPVEQLAIVVLSNGGQTGVPEGLTESFFDLVIDGKLQRDWLAFADRMAAADAKQEFAAERDYSHPAAPSTPALKLPAYTGKYENALFGEIEIAEKDPGLVLRLGPQAMEFALRHWDRDVFIYQPTGESAGGLTGVRFSVTPEGKADRVLIEYLDIHGQGTFTRETPKQ